MTANGTPDPRTSDAPPTERPPEALVAATLGLWREAGRQQRFPASGQSMWPLIQADDLLWVSHGQNGLRRGDVVVFISSGQLVAHRLLRITDAGASAMLLTKGDNAPHPDPPLAAADVVGRILRVERGGRALRLDTRGARACGWLMATATLWVMALRRWLPLHLAGVWDKWPSRVLRRLASAAVRGVRALLLKTAARPRSRNR